MAPDTEEQTNALPVLRRALWRLCRLDVHDVTHGSWTQRLVRQEAVIDNIQ